MGKRKSRKFRGYRTHGVGQSNKKGKGYRGGKGRAGVCKHHSMIYGPKKGERGFHSITKKHLTILNLGDVERDLEKLLEQGIAKPYMDGYFVDLTQLGVDKLLGKGNLSFKLYIPPIYLSRGARQKLERWGGIVSQ